MHNAHYAVGFVANFVKFLRDNSLLSTYFVGIMPDAAFLLHCR